MKSSKKTTVIANEESTNVDLPLDDNAPPIGYKVIKGHLVPFSFLDLLSDRLSHACIPQNKVLSPRDLLDTDDWLSFDEAER